MSHLQIKMYYITKYIVCLVFLFTVLDYEYSFMDDKCSSLLDCVTSTTFLTSVPLYVLWLY